MRDHSARLVDTATIPDSIVDVLCYLVTLPSRGAVFANAILHPKTRTLNHHLPHFKGLSNEELFEGCNYVLNHSRAGFEKVLRIVPSLSATRCIPFLTSIPLPRNLEHALEVYGLTSTPAFCLQLKTAFLRKLQLRCSIPTARHIEVLSRLGVVSIVECLDTLFTNTPGNDDAPFITEILKTSTDSRLLNRVLSTSITIGLDDVVLGILTNPRVNVKLGRHSNLIAAIINQRYKILAALLAHPSTNIDAEDSRPLKLAIERSDGTAVRILLNHGCSVETLTHGEHTSARYLYTTAILSNK